MLLRRSNDVKMGAPFRFFFPKKGNGKEHRIRSANRPDLVSNVLFSQKSIWNDTLHPDV